MGQPKAGKFVSWTIPTPIVLIIQNLDYFMLWLQWIELDLFWFGCIECIRWCSATQTTFLHLSGQCLPWMVGIQRSGTHPRGLCHPCTCCYARSHRIPMTLGKAHQKDPLYPSCLYPNSTWTIHLPWRNRGRMHSFQAPSWWFFCLQPSLRRLQIRHGIESMSIYACQWNDAASHACIMPLTLCNRVDISKFPSRHG